MKYIILLLSLIIYNCSNAQTTIHLISSLHKFHKNSKFYNYDSLYHRIETLHPDVIGIEIREQDLYKNDDYLAKFYPQEMYSIKKKFSNKKIYGIDWLGDEIHNKDLSEEYFLNMPAKVQLKKLNEDTLFASKMLHLKKLNQQQYSIIENGNFVDIHDGKLDSINREYYLEMEQIFTNTPYQIIIDTYKKRDRKIYENIQRIIDKNPNSTIVIIVGADHRFRLLQYLKDNKNSINIIEHYK